MRGSTLIVYSLLIPGYVPGVNWLLKYWGYVALALAIAGWVGHWFGWAIILILSLAALGYFLIAAPLYCGATTRDGLSCRNNSRGILLGCHLRQHKMQRLKKAFVSRRWSEVWRDLMGTPRELMATSSAMAAVVSAIAAVIALH
jgi:hypothetical protein